MRSFIALPITAGAPCAGPIVVPQPASHQARGGALGIAAGFWIAPGGTCAQSLGGAWHRTLHHLAQIPGIKRRSTMSRAR